jgi:hypothetical protein
MYIIIKTLCVSGIPNRHNIHNLKYIQNSTSAVPQVIVRNVPNVHKVPNQHIIYFTYSGWRAQPVRNRLCQIRLHYVLASSPKMLGAAWQVWTSCFLGTWILVNQCIRPPCTGQSAPAKIAQTGSHVALWFYLLHCARDACVCWNWANIFLLMVCQKWRPKPVFPLFIYWDPFDG